MNKLGRIVANHFDLDPWIFPSTASILSFICVANRDAVDSKPYQSVEVWSLVNIPTDE